MKTKNILISALFFLTALFGQAAYAYQGCYNCGVVLQVREVETQARGHNTGLGVVGGALVGGALGNQIGDGNGRTAATVVGAVGGAMVGNRIESNMRSNTRYEVVVRMSNGSTRTVVQEDNPRVRRGDRVRIVNGEVVEL